MPIVLDRNVVIPDEELTWTASRSGGPGGQNVNKVNTRVTLYFDVARSPSLGDAKKRRILERLSSRISREGVLRVVAQQGRTQRANLDAAIRRMQELLRGALAEARHRIPTRPSAAAENRRIGAKKRRGEVKRARATRSEPED